MKQYKCVLQKRSGRRFLSFFLVFLLLVLFQSCSSEKDIGASFDDFNQVHKGPSYPAPSYDLGAFFYNCFMEWLTDFDFWELSANNSAEQKKHFSKLNLLVKLQYIKKGSQNKYNNGKTVTKLNYIEIPLYALYQSRLSSGGRIFGGIGPYAGYSIDGKIKSTNNGQTTSINAFTQAGGFKRFDAGLALIAGYKTPNDIGLSLGYEFGLANVAIANAGGDKIKNRGFSFNVSYSLDKIIEGSKK